ncbi:MAG: hypothetical protein Q8R13_02715 [bacterium]|nr:hypothetical protein [bacterium]MDZ4296394.1 hypothetical protein [Patescibacteria group bacterium]
MESQRLPSREITVALITGLVGVGKSAVVETLGRFPEFQGDYALITSLDEIRRQYWGPLLEAMPANETGRSRRLYDVMSEEERIFSNKLLRDTIQHAILFKGKTLVVADALMLTRKDHQEPFLAMLTETEALVRSGEAKRAGLAGILPPDPPSSIAFRPVLLFADFAAHARRIRRRSTRPPDEALIPFFETTAQYEFPEVYTPLTLENSGDDPNLWRELIESARRYILGLWSPTERIVRERLTAAKAEIAPIKEEVARRGWRQ